jgi:hypothetical protein
MKHKTLLGVFAFYEVTFQREPNVGLVILWTTRFAFIMIIGFDLVVVEMKNIIVGII